jgi:hypothetical protein
MGKEFLKWCAIAFVLYFGWKYLAGVISNYGTSNPAPQQISPAQYNPTQYVIGVYGPVAIPYTNPFYSSPGNPRRRWPRPY